MIEVKNLFKTYNVKGNITKALDDVSIKFPETGMVFLLGKSGSGKSTLLNVCGGLDKADSGEIIIMGKSSSTFSKADFDSYRNTYVGFVFQEYNILNEFSIEDNLSLALELQGKRKNKELVKKLLEQVDLTGFGKRKPNTLSGGQKQRIAIARALIKDPKIIMADEPTGALDSKTGKQVFDTLKKLSKNRLVIVVSHDREFSEIYGDRIIELKDGKILSDETKEKIESKKINDNISLISDSTLSITDSKKLKPEDINKIVEFINNTDGELLISKDDNDINSFKTINHIDNDNKTEKFIDTKPESIKTKQYTKDDTKFIKSKLPMSKASKMGISSLKVKPIRLIFTMLLTIISFVLFGVASALMDFNAEKVTKNSFDQSEYNDVAITNHYNINYKYYYDDKLQSEYTSKNNTYFTKKEIEELASKYGNNILPVIATSTYKEKLSIFNVSSTSNTPKTMLDSSCEGFAIANSNSKYMTNLIGTYPVNKDDIAISNYYAKLLLNSRMIDLGTNEVLTNSSINDLIGKKLKISIYGYEITCKITAIFDTQIPSKYSSFDDKRAVDEWAKEKLDAFSLYLSDTPNKIFLVNENFYKYYYEQTGSKLNPQSNNNKYFNYSNTCRMFLDSNTENWNYISSYNLIDNIALPVRELSSSTSDSVIISIYDLYNLINNSIDHYVSVPNEYWSIDQIAIIQNIYSKYYKLARDKELEIADSYHTEEEKTAFHDKYDHFRTIETEVNILEFIGTEEANEQAEEYRNDPDYINYKYTTDYTDYFNGPNYYDFKEYYKYQEAYNLIDNIYRYNDFHFLGNYDNYIITADELNQLLDLFDYLVKDKFTTLNVTIEISNDKNDKTTINRTISGYYLRKEDGVNYGIYVNKADETYYKPKNYSTTTTNYVLEDSPIYYSSCFVPIKEGNNNIFSEVEKVKNNDEVYQVDNHLYNSISTVVNLISNLKQVFFYIGLILAGFAALLLFNFISVSISSKTHEIGVLRAVGARGNDVFKIFFSESLFIALLSFIIAIIAAFIIVIILNNYITAQLGMTLKLLTFGPLSVVLMLGIALVVAIIGTFIPVFIIARKKPVDSLRSL